MFPKSRKSIWPFISHQQPSEARLRRCPPAQGVRKTPSLRQHYINSVFASLNIHHAVPQPGWGIQHRNPKLCLFLPCFKLGLMAAFPCRSCGDGVCALLTSGGHFLVAPWPSQTSPGMFPPPGTFPHPWDATKAAIQGSSPTLRWSKLEFN